MWLQCKVCGGRTHQEWCSWSRSEPLWEGPLLYPGLFLSCPLLLWQTCTRKTHRRLQRVKLTGQSLEINCESQSVRISLSRWTADTEQKVYERSCQPDQISKREGDIIFTWGFDITVQACSENSTSLFGHLLKSCSNNLNLTIVLNQSMCLQLRGAAFLGEKGRMCKNNNNNNNRVNYHHHHQIIIMSCT